MTTTQTTGPTYIPRVSLYFADRGMRTLPISQALELAAETTLILGRMREGYLGREVVTADDLRRWDHENEAAAQWADVATGEGGLS